MKIAETIKSIVITSLAIAVGAKLLANFLERPSIPTKPPYISQGHISIEQEVAEVAKLGKLRGLPRPVSDSINLISISSQGRSIYAIYEFNAPAAIPITNSLLQELQSEILLSFKNSQACQDQTTRRLLRSGMTYHQAYNLYNSNQTILKISLKESDCNY